MPGFYQRRGEPYFYRRERSPSWPTGQGVTVYFTSVAVVYQEPLERQPRTGESPARLHAAPHGTCGFAPNLQLPAWILW